MTALQSLLINASNPIPLQQLLSNDQARLKNLTQKLDQAKAVWKDQGYQDSPQFEQYLTYDLTSLQKHVDTLTHQSNEVDNMLKATEFVLQAENCEDLTVCAQIVKAINEMKISSANTAAQNYYQRLLNEATVKFEEKCLELFGCLDREEFVLDISLLTASAQLLSDKIVRRVVGWLFRGIFSYNVGRKFYQLGIWKSLEGESNKAFRREYYQFSRNECNTHFNSILMCLQSIGELCKALKSFLSVSHLVQSVENAIQSQWDSLLANVNHVLPFLSLQQRSRLFKVTQKEQAQLSIYELIIKLKVPGQSADSLSETVGLISEAVLEGGQDEQVLMDFLEICSLGRQLIGVGFFCCDELARLTSQKVLTDTQYAVVERLLTMREKLRTRIHAEMK